MFKPTKLPPGTEGRFASLFVDAVDAADLLLAGVPYDVSVLGRKGTKEGPRGIREAFRFLGTDAERPLDTAIHDLGDVTGLGEDVLAAHATVRSTLAPIFEHGKPVILLGGDHGLTYAHVAALSDHVEGPIGIVVIDAHYDLRSYDSQPSSGTPFRRILEELSCVRGHNLVEIGIRPYANAAALAKVASQKGVRVMRMEEIRRRGIEVVAKEALAQAGEGVDHLWLSIDIDGLDQSVAAGCSAPGAGGLTFEEAAAIVRFVAMDSRCRGMDIMEVAPGLDPTGNTTRTAAQLVATFADVVGRRMDEGPSARHAARD